MIEDERATHYEEGPRAALFGTPESARVPYAAEPSDGLGRFLRRAARHELLTAEEERELAQRIERGDLTAKSKLTEHNVRLVVDIAKDVARKTSYELEDLVQEGFFGLIRATEKFDWRRGYKFSTYAVPWIRQSIQRGLENTGRAIRLPAHQEQHLRTADKVARKLTAELGRDPTDEEIVDQMAAQAHKNKITAGDLADLKRLSTKPSSLDKAIGDGADPTPWGELLPDDQARTEDEAILNKVRTAVLESIRHDLHPEEQAVIMTLYFNGHNGNRRKVAESLNRTLDQVLELEASGLATLHERVAGGDRSEFREWWSTYRPPASIEEVREAVWSIFANDPDASVPDVAEQLGIRDRQVTEYRSELPMAKGR